MSVREIPNPTLSPNLQARFCKLYPADFSVAIYLFWCSPLQSFMDFCFHLVQNPPPGFFQTGSGAFSAAPSARTFDAMTHPKTALEHCVQVKRSLISIFWKSRVYLDHSISTVKIGRIELAESSLQIRAQVSSRKIDLVTGVTLDSCRFCES